MCIRNIFFIKYFLPLWFVTSVCTAQSPATSDTVRVTGGSVVTLRGALLNNDTLPHPYSIRVVSPFRVMNDIADHITAPACDSKPWLLKLYIPKKVSAMQHYVVEVIASTADKRRPAIASKYILQVAPRRMIALRPDQEAFYLHHRDDTLAISLQCNNRGNTKEPIKIWLQDPLQPTAHIYNTALILTGFSDTSFVIKVPLSALSAEKSQRQLLLRAAYADGKIFYSRLLQVYLLFSKRTYTGAGNTGQTTHAFSLYMNNAGGNRPFYTARGKGMLQIAEGLLDYHINVAGRPGAPSFPVNAANSRLYYQKGKLAIRAGNIQVSDGPLQTGSGLAVNVKPWGKGEISAGYINNENPGAAGRLVYGSYDRTFSPLFSASLQLRRYYHIGGADYTMAATGIVLHPADGQQIDLMAQSSIRDAAGHTGVIFSPQLSGAFSVRYYGRMKKWHIASGNYISVPGYLGRPNSLLSLNEEIRYTINNRATGRFRYMHTRDKGHYAYGNTSPYYFLRNMQLLSAGYYLQLPGKLACSLEPVWYKELTGDDVTGTARYTMLETTRLGATLSGPGLFSLTVEIGAGSAFTKAHSHFLSGRMRGNFRYSAFSANFLLQQGPCNLPELYAAALPPDRQQSVAANTSYRIPRLGKHIQAALYYDIGVQSGYNRATHHLYLQSRITLPYQFLLDLSINKYTHPLHDRTQTLVNAGLIKQFSANARNSSLNLHLFYDRNGNSRYDKGEPPMEDVICKIGDLFFRSDVQGNIQYRHIPDGNYNISIQGRYGYYATPQTIPVKKHTSLHIPLQQLGIINGMLKADSRSSALQQDGNFSQVVIEAVDPNGRAFTAVSSPSGAFTFCLPVNSYQLRIRCQTLPPVFICNDATYSVEASSNKQKTATFTVTRKLRKNSVRRFR